MPRKSVGQKRFVDKATKEINAGKAPDVAVREAAKEAFGSETSLAVNAPIVREELGLDAEETRADFGTVAVTQFKKAMAGEFPAWLGEDPKLRLEFMKTFKGTLETALVTKTEKRIIETDDTRGRTEEELAHFVRYGKYPEEMTVNGDPKQVN